jgi:hypothetical protein
MVDDLRTRFPDLEPVTSSPSLGSLNGVGLVMYGRRDVDAETGTYVKTRCACLVFLPLWAIDSWRVADANGGGWLLIGRCAISSFARFWNLLMLSALLIGGGSLGWQFYTETPGYQAGQRLAEAQQVVAKGQLAPAARIFSQIAEGGTSHAGAAAAALAAIVTGPLAQAPVQEQARVVAVLAELADSARIDGIRRPEVAALAERLAAAAGAPRPAIAILDAAAMVMAEARLASERGRILEAAHAADLADPWAAIELAVIAEKAGDKERCRSLLEPCADKLGDGEGARILGAIYAGLGRIEDSHRLLRPYVMTRLKQLQSAAEAYEQAQTAALKAAYEALNSQAAGHDWYAAYKAKDEAGQQQMVQEWLRQRIGGDPVIAAAETRLRAVAPVVPVALDLGIVTIQRAQGLADPALRKAELEEAERIFLAIRGIAGETDAYRQWLAQVDYWLGKPEEGRKLLDELLAAKQRDVATLLAVSEVLREVGDRHGASALAEESYKAAKTDEDRHHAALQRSLLFTDGDDHIAWLERCDQKSPYVTAELPAARGTKAHRDGRDQEAISELTRSLAAWTAMPRSASSLNNGATVAQGLYGISGDPEHLRIACSRLEEAFLLMPSHTVLLQNLLESRRQLAGAECVRGTLDAQAIGQALDTDQFVHCFADTAGRRALITRYLGVAAHQNVVADCERLMLMAPRSIRGYATLYSDLVLTRDAKALAALATRVASADLDHTESWKEMREHLAGSKDAQRIAESAASAARLEVRVKALRGAGKDATLALALDALAATRLGGAALAQTVDYDACVALAEEANKLHPCQGTDATLIAALIHRAAVRQAQQDATLAGLIADHRRMLSSVQVLLHAASDGRWRAALSADPDLVRAAHMTVASMQADPEGCGLWDWALLAAIGDPAQAAAAELLRADPLQPLVANIGPQLRPASASEALQASLHQRLLGDAARASAELEAARKRGLPLGAGL